MTDIIHDASSKRFKVSDDDPKSQGIAITDGWFEELNKHPYHSSKPHVVDLVEKPGTGIFLMKENAKLYKA
jgi:phage terminase large subunit